MRFHDDFSFDSTQSTENDLSKPIRRSVDDWLLYALECPIAMNNRALTFG
jgi:acyl-CoA thioesterase